MAGKILRGIFLVVLIGYFLSLGASYFSYIEPYLFPLRLIQGNARLVTENIIIGPYPRDRDFEKLVKVKKVTVFISLLNPSLPFEKDLIRKEREILDSLGVAFYNVPLSFINLESPENYRAITRIREIIQKHKNEKIYIHCYLGRHRVEFVAKNLLGVVK